jgi:DNA polymerase-3 subunit delta
LAGKIKETITTKHLTSKGLSNQSIADYFNISSGRAYYMIQNANNQEFKFLEFCYKTLAELDYKIKSGQIDKNLGLELWLLGGYDVK